MIRDQSESSKISQSQSFFSKLLGSLPEPAFHGSNWFGARTMSVGVLPYPPAARRLRITLATAAIDAGVALSPTSPKIVRVTLWPPRPSDRR